MEPTPELIDAIFIEKVLRARRMPPDQKLLAGARLFDYARGIAMAGIRAQNPGASPERVRELFRQRLKIARWLEGSL